MSLRRPVVFGEVLYDVFPDGRDVLGGASFNVAWNLQGLGARPLFVSRVGADERGERVLDAMREFGMDTAGIQVDPDRPTGEVRVSLTNGQPSYEIVPNQAWDAIDAEAAANALQSAADVALLYHGTLATRSLASLDALSALRAAGKLPIFFDANLRAPWWNLDALRSHLFKAEFVKINDEELGAIIERPDFEDHELEREAHRLSAEYAVEELIVTMGARGAVVVESDGEVLDCEPPPPKELVDTVGAGDAFCAVMILGYLSGWSNVDRLRRAVRFAASACERRGATTLDRDVYAAFVRRWET